VTGTMTWVGLDVHARSIHAAAVELDSGELRRARFGGEPAPVVDCCCGSRNRSTPAKRAGPTGFGLCRAARAAGLRLDVVAPTKTPRPWRSDQERP